ncbi:MAG: hypothetical protein QM728_13495 [Gordonia sp. (in: high G+C Gram-positive bacteria)]|uniref:hypothetical protein n=1 Tax=Gordonia sp. (in: high G+C Gram-positive bacteria) TaxID=84139 RepID=UPI0039E6DEBF
MQEKDGPAVRPSAAVTTMVEPSAEKVDGPLVVPAQSGPPSAEHSVVGESEYHDFDPGEDYFELHEQFDSYATITDAEPAQQAGARPAAGLLNRDVPRWAVPAGGAAAVLVVGIGIVGVAAADKGSAPAKPETAAVPTAEPTQPVPRLAAPKAKAPAAPVTTQPLKAMRPPVQVSVPQSQNQTSRSGGPVRQRARRSAPRPPSINIPGLPPLRLP